MKPNTPSKLEWIVTIVAGPFVWLAVAILTVVYMCLHDWIGNDPNES